MYTVIITALVVGGATIFGGAAGLIFRRTSKPFSDGVLSFAAGVMLAAAMLGLILPSLELGGKWGVFTTVLGIFLGAFLVHLLDLLAPFFCRKGEASGDRGRRVFLFVTAIAMHNLPEGIAAGVGFGTGDEAGGILIATAIALQNIPEGMIVSVAMLGVGTRPHRAFLIASLTGIIEIFGTFIGYFAVSISAVFLPLILAIAGGSMLYVISEEMIPETHSGEGSRISTYFLLVGFALMLILNALI